MQRSTSVRIAAAMVAALSLGPARGAYAQSWWPTEPVGLAGGRVVLGADVSLTAGTTDPGWFTYTDYETSALRRVRAGLAVEARVTSRVSVVLELRLETGRGLDLYAGYVRIRPWANGRLDVQAGRIPPVFGAYARRSYPKDNPLIGDPLLYQYLTSLRVDAVPASSDDLLAMRGRGWLVRYPLGSQDWRNGVPTIASTRWASGVEARITKGWLEAASSVTVGSLSFPRIRRAGSAPTVSGRISVTPRMGLVLGVSASDGEFLDKAVQTELPPARQGPAYRQRALGLDGEYSLGHWLVRGELVTSRWALPDVDEPVLGEPLRAHGGFVEARYRIGPRLFVAARGDRLAFSAIHGSRETVTWDANVSRLEVGAGLTLRRGLLVKGAYMFNDRSGGRVRRDHLWAAQVLVWF